MTGSRKYGLLSKIYMDERLEALSHTGYALATSYLNFLATGKKEEGYDESNEQFNKGLVFYSVDRDGFDIRDLKDTPNVYDDIMFQQRFNNVLAEVIRPIVPELISRLPQRWVEVHAVGWGDSASFKIESNQLYTVNQIARDVGRGGVQTVYNNEVTVKTERLEVAPFVDWYAVACGLVDWGEFVAKIGRSYMAYLNAIVANQLRQLGTNSDEFGITGYKLNGWDDSEFMNLVQKISWANGGAEVIAYGTRVALSKIAPDQADGFRFFEGDQLVTEGLLPRYKGAYLMPYNQVYSPFQINADTIAPIYDDNQILLIPVSASPFIKVVVSGNTIKVERSPDKTSDRTYGMSVQTELGTAIVTGDKIGVINIVAVP